MENESAWSRAIERARQRQADRLEHDSTADASSTSERVDAGQEKSTAETKAAFQIMNKVANYLYEDDPRKTANNITKLKLLSTGTRDFVDNIPLGEFHSKLNEAGSTAKALHEKTYPKNGLPEARPDPDDDLAPVPASNLIWAVGPILKFLSAKTKSVIVRDVHNISNPDAKADAIAALAGYIGDLEHKDQKSLIDEAIVFFGEEGKLNTFRREIATEAIAKAFEYLDPDQRLIIDGLRLERPELGKLLDSHIDKFEAKSIAARATHIGDLATQDQWSLLDKAIGIFGEEGKLPTFRRRKAAEAIAKAHDYLKNYPEHLEKLKDIRNERPTLGKLLDSHIDKFEAKLLAAKAEHIDDLEPHNQQRLIDRAIEIIGKKDQPYPLEKDASDTIAKASEKLTETHNGILEDLLLVKEGLGYTLELSRHEFRGNLRERLDRASSDRSLLEPERVETMRSISEVIPDKLQLARKKFINSTRSRARSFGR
ncbi:hypothetical protein [Rhizobium leguminosarum]|uniref:hypothetical protein n=1 Tax=Rhizobium leguminosarum TaxID=384 RepID=UPI001C94FEF8|nr:hypothetical protein [Rhizobium leguminosarum]MBY5827930.1 hypothetical protein [Rhizobium leguminosarum]